MTVKTVEVDLIVRHAAETKAAIDEIARRADELKKNFPTYKLQIDKVAASETLRVFRAQLAEATKTRTAEVKVKVDDSALAKLQKLADSAKGAGGPAFLGPALLALPGLVTLTGLLAGAATGLAGAFTAGAGSLLAFGAVAKPVLSDALKAQAAVNTAQNNYTVAIANGVSPAKAYRAEQIAIGKAYAELSPQQIALSKQLGNMAQAWQDLKAAQTPVVAGALQPWLRSVTDLTGKLAPIIAKVSPVIRDLGVQFGNLINSAAFTKFRDFIAGTGAQAVGAAGGTIIDLVKSFVILLPQFNPLIEKAVGWIAALGPAVLKWASSKNAAADITKFMDWFNRNGPVLGGLLKNIGAALANLAPGLSAGGVTELKIISDFFGFIAKLPKGIAGPLAETAGALLILNKLGVVSVGLKIIGPAAKWLSGGLIDIGGGATAAAEIRAAFATGGAAAAAQIRAAMAGGAVPGAAGGAKGAAGGLGAGGLAATAGELLGIITLAGAAAVAIGEIFSKITTGKFENFAQWKAKFLSSLDSMRHAAASFGDGVVQDWNLVWANTITRTARGFHDLAGWFNTGRHDIAAHMSEIVSNIIDAWNKIWNNTVGRIQRGFHDVAGLFDTGRHNIAAVLDQIRAGAALAWNQLWADTVGKVAAGIAKVVAFFKTLPGQITGALGDAAKVLSAWGAGVITGLLQGMESVITDVWNFIKSIPSKILHFLGLNSPPAWAIQAGKDIMNGIGIGMNQARASLKKATDAAAAAAAAAASKVGGGPATGDAAAAQGYAQSRLGAYGWGGGQMGPLILLWNQESGWNRFAYNAGSGATGIPQSLPYTKMPRAAWLPSQGGQANMGAQVDWGLGYIASTYGSPAGAWAHEQAHGWYDRGGWLRPGLTMALNTTGRPEQVIPGGGLDALAAELRALRAEVRALTGVAAAIPERTGRHVAAGVNGAAASASFRVRYP